MSVASGAIACRPGGAGRSVAARRRLRGERRDPGDAAAVQLGDGEPVAERLARCRPPTGSRPSASMTKPATVSYGPSGSSSPVAVARSPRG